MAPPAPITKLLVANRGEIARRVMRSARRLSIATVAVHSDPDADAPFVREADESVRLPGAAPADTYLDIERILGAARRTGADAVHPGYGFLSENARFAKACAEDGLIFVGPSPEAIETMGSKVTAKELMDKAGVPVLPGAVIDSVDDARAAAVAIGWPLLVKAAYGGGGRGMRVVRSEEEVAPAVDSARREAAAAFGDATLFVERYVEAPRHVEVQVFGDHTGNVVHLFERECSIQRRYQKIVEEAPSPAVDEALRAALGSAAVTAAKTLGYVGAGTVEFVLSAEGSFYFLEVNTRLQVEHPVTEAITGLDLVALQLAVAGGAALPPAATQATMTGHAVEARLYAEDVQAGFLPVSGTVERIRFPDAEGIRVDSGVEDGSVVSTHYDALLAKVIATGPTRQVAARRLGDALAAARLHGVVTNRDLLVRVLRHREFLAGQTDTGFLARHAADLARPLAGPETRRVHAAAAALEARAERLRAARVQPTIPPGWRNVGEGWHRTVLRDHQGGVEVGYRMDGHHLVVTADGEPLEDPRATSTPGVFEVTAGGIGRRYEVLRSGGRLWVDSTLGSSVFTEQDRFPLPDALATRGSLRAPMPGSVVRVLAEPGDVVGAGDVLVVLEAMKMEHPVRSPHPGVVGEVRVVAGDQVEAESILVVLEDPATPNGG